MSKKTWPSLSPALAYGTPLNAGRAVYVPEYKSIYSAFTIVNDKKEPKTIKVLTNAFEWRLQEETEVTVSYVTDKRRSDAGVLAYCTTFTDGSISWLPASNFIDDDGTCTIAWLEFTDLAEGFDEYTSSQLLFVCRHNNWKTSGSKADLQSRVIRHLMELKSTPIGWSEENLVSYLGSYVYYLLLHYIALKPLLTLSLGREKVPFQVLFVAIIPITTR
jgi:hypothetical protein